MKHQIEISKIKETNTIISTIDIINKQEEKHKKILKGLKPLMYSDNNSFGEKIYNNFEKEKIKVISKYYGSDDDDDEETQDFIIKDDKFIAIGNSYPQSSSYLMVFYSKLKEKELLEYIRSKIENRVILKPGTYSLEKDFMTGWGMKKITLSKEDFIVLNEDYSKKIIRDIKNFFNSKEFYENNNLTHKRGILLYGAVGCGKSTLIRKILKIMNKNTYTIIVGENTEISESMFRYIKDKLKNKPKILVFEDIDGIEERQRSSLLNFIDGIKDNSNTLFIATTNHPQKLDAAISNRPSRFDTVKEIEMPNNESRAKLLKHYFKNLKKKDLDNAVKLTEGFSGAYFKELFIFSMLRNISLVDSINELQKQNKQFVDYKTDDSMFG